MRYDEAFRLVLESGCHEAIAVAIEAVREIEPDTDSAVLCKMLAREGIKPDVCFGRSCPYWQGNDEDW